MRPASLKHLFEDASHPVRAAGFNDAFFADDLNCYKAYASSCRNEALLEEMAECQEALHTWGRANQVQFDAGKESFHVLSRREPEGEDFKMLGVEWDTKLTMVKEAEELARRCYWKLKTILRSRRYFTLPQLVQQYKSHILPYLEAATPALYHATNTVLKNVNRVQDAFLRGVGLTREAALQDYKLAPLETRRDIAMLGVVHRTVLGQGPPHFRKWFCRDERQAVYTTRLQARAHDKQLEDYVDGSHTDLLRRSALGLPKVYNKLPDKVVQHGTVKDFQKALQQLVLEELNKGNENWHKHLSPRT